MRLIGLSIVAVAAAYAQSTPVPMNGLQLHHVKVETVNYQGRDAVRLTSDSADLDDGARLALIPNTSFDNGTIELDLTGDAIPGSSEAYRGFTGVAFRVDPAGAKYECFYLRPLNGRSKDQLQRNHSTQYISYPEFPWQRLRQETPGKYESYVDLSPGAWTKVRIAAHDAHAELFVNGAEQPTLIVNDLKHGMSKGGVALWIGPGVVAHFANLRITPAR